MIKLGQVNTLKVSELVDFGAYLVEDGKEEQVLLPKRYMPKNIKVSDDIDVFIYTDSEDRIIATTETPKAMVGDIAILKVVDVAKVGAFLDWGLMKDLFVPFREQQVPMEVGESYPVHIRIDHVTERIVASSRVNGYLQDKGDFQLGQEVKIMVYAENQFGFTVAVNKEYRAMLYNKDVYKRAYVGLKTVAYINNIREDGKIDVSLQRRGFEKVNDEVENIFNIIMMNDGYLEVTDKSSPEEIKNIFGVSKNVFKKAIGILYKQKRILLEEKGISVVGDEEEDEEGY